MKDIPLNANTMSSHVLYRGNAADDNSFSIKARIATHGNEDSFRHVKKTDCCICIPMGFRLVLATAVVRVWITVKIDILTAFLQTGTANAISMRCHRTNSITGCSTGCYRLLHMGLSIQVLNGSTFLTPSIENSVYNLYPLFLNFSQKWWAENWCYWLLGL